VSKSFKRTRSEESGHKVKAFLKKKVRTKDRLVDEIEVDEAVERYMRDPRFFRALKEF
jgi:hypothetical protein